MNVLRSFVLVGLLLSVMIVQSSDVPPAWKKLISTDALVFSHYSNAKSALASSHLPTDDSGLIGRNR